MECGDNKYTCEQRKRIREVRQVNGINPVKIPITTGRPFNDNSFATGTAISGNSFQDILSRRIATDTGQLTFSKHAQARTEQRGISLSETDMTKLDNAVGKARDKGLKDTLVLMNNTAYIVNVPSKVVVTVVDGSDSENNVFTNIDGAVIV